jgi:hypothetical protein
MSASHDDDLLRIQAESAEAAARQGADPGHLAAQLAGMQSSAMGAAVADRYTAMGARWLSDAAPTRLDQTLIDRLSRLGFRSERLADVRIHRGPKAQQAADALTARAFALGENDIYFAQGQFDPHTRGGLAVLAHELAHVAPPDSQADGVAPAAGGGIPTSFGGPLLNERKRGDEDLAGAEAHERQAREAEARVFAQEDLAAAPQMAARPGPAAAAPAGGEGASSSSPNGNAPKTSAAARPDNRSAAAP